MTIWKIRAPHDGKLAEGLNKDAAEMLMRTLKCFQDNEGDYWVFALPDGVSLG